jgi:Mrp family chromosome partitioning ATPase
VNNYQATTFKTSLAGAAFVSSRGEVYRLFQEDDDPTLGNDFLINDLEQNEFEQNDLEQNDLEQNEFEKQNSHNENKQIQINNKSDSEFNNQFSNESQPNLTYIENKKIDNKINDTTTKIEQIEITANNPHDESIDELIVIGNNISSERRFRIVTNNCESAVAELLALEAPKPIINVPKHIPPQEVSFDEKIRRVRGVIGICGKFQPTIPEKILSETNKDKDNICKLGFSVTKNPLFLPASSVKKNHLNKSIIDCGKSSGFKSESKLSFQLCQDNTANEVNEIIRKNKIPVLDCTPDFFNTIPKTIPFIQKQKSNKTTNNQTENYDNIETASYKITDENNSRNNVTINNKTELKSDNEENISAKILQFPASGNVNSVVSAEVNSADAAPVYVESDVVLMRRTIIDYEIPTRIDELIGKASGQVADLGDRFIDFINAGKRVIGLNGCFAGDGCSLVSVFAAIELSARGKRVLLIDSNWRNPALAKILNAGDIAKHEIVTLKNNLDFMTMFDKKIIDNSHNIIRNDKKYDLSDNDNSQVFQINTESKLFRFIRNLSCSYDFILFDSGSINDLSFNDCVNKWKIMCIDGIFFVVSKNNFKLLNFNNITKRLLEHQIELLGIMICKE